MQQISAQQLAEWLADEQRASPLLLDVREPWEFEHCHIAGSRSLPMQQVPAGCAELDAGQETVVICHHGMRSLQVAMFLERQGFAHIHNLAGGVDAWATQVDPNLPRY